jgi:hypothetical protein
MPPTPLLGRSAEQARKRPIRGTRKRPRGETRWALGGADRLRAVRSLSGRESFARDHAAVEDLDMAAREITFGDVVPVMIVMPFIVAATV